jgi:hypothetical protein
MKIIGAMALAFVAGVGSAWWVLEPGTRSQTLFKAGVESGVQGALVDIDTCLWAATSFGAEEAVSAKELNVRMDECMRDRAASGAEWAAKQLPGSRKA